jgi:penicillin-binding protein 1A
MNIPVRFPPVHWPVLRSIPPSVLKREPFGFLSGLANAWVVIGCGILGLVASLPLPPSVRYPIEQTLRPAIKRPLVLLGADGQPFAKRGDCMAAPVTLDELPRHFVDALLAMEDRRFYSHIGIDPFGILRAVKRNYAAGGTREGGSTITQQLVKMSFLTSARTLDRKLEEALLAMWLELRLTKGQILERYLNSAYFGEGCFGVRAAARHFFAKPVQQLTLWESAHMVALLRSPTQLTNNLDDANQRARLVVQAMVRDGRLEKASLADAQPAQLDAARTAEIGGYYADWLTETLQKDMDAPHSRQPIQVYTTFDPGLQRMAQEAVRSVLEKQGRKQNASQAAVVAMRTDGRVVAMVGGKEEGISQFNRAVQARRQPGSAFKTFVYLAALRAGASPDTLVVDEPISIDGWEPKNYDGEHRGAVTLTQAFAASINTVAVTLSEAVGREAVIAAARDLGIGSPLAPNASLALGTSEVSLLEMTAAYAAIAAGAFPVKSWGVAGLDAAPADGGRPPRDAGLWKLAEADELRELMSAVVEGGSGHAASLRIPAFGKTGTSQEHRDAWFVGFAGNLVVGVWVGNDDGAPMKRVTGGGLPAQIWKQFMQGALKSDRKFERKLPKIAAFEARRREVPDRQPSIAALDVTFISADPKPSGTTRYEHISTRGLYERQAPATERAERRRSAVSTDFQSRLRAMGWPGQE